MMCLKSFFASTSHTGIAQRTALAAYFVRVASAGLAYLTQIILARYIGSFDYGVYVMVWTWVLILGHVASLGLCVTPELFIPKYTQEKSFCLLRGYAFFARGVTFGSATIMGVIGIIGLFFFGGFLEQYYLWPLYIAFFALPFFAITETLDGIGRCYNAPSIALGPPYILRPILIIVFMLAFHHYGYPNTATTAMMAALIACWVTAALQTILISKLLKKHAGEGAQSFAPRLWLMASLPLLFAESARVLLQNVDILVLGRFVSPSDVAVYFAVSKTLALAIFVNFAVGAAVSHRFTEYYVTDNKKELDGFIAKSSLWSFSATALALLVMIGLGQLFLSFFGAEFVKGYWLIFIFSIGILIRSMIGPAERLLSIHGKQVLLAQLLCITFVLTFILLLVLTPLYGAMGSAIAVSLSGIIETALLSAVIYKKLHLNVFFKVPNILGRK